MHPTALSISPNGKDHGKLVQVKGEWDDEFLERLPRDVPLDFVLNEAYGWWPEFDLSILKAIKNIRSLSIVSREKIGTVPVLPSLEYLHLAVKDYDPIEFQKFEALKTCALRWRKSAASITSCSSLSELNVSDFKFHDLSVLFPLTNLERLTITTSPMASLAGIEQFQKLNSLDLNYFRKLVDLEPIRACIQLQNFSITHSKKFTSIEAVSSLENLIHLSLDDCGTIETLKPVLQCKRLKTLSFIATTVVADGDLGILLQHASLGRLTYQNRRHYSHECRDWHIVKFPHLDWPKTLG